MAKLEDKGTRGLPPAPAPPRRGANPWKLSDTARKREPEAKAWPAQLEDILDDLQPGAGAPRPPKRDEPPAAPVAREPPRADKRAGGGAWPLFVLLIAIGIIVKVVSEAADTGEWRGAIAPIIAILFIAHGWWRMRRRREEKRRQDGGTTD